MATIKSFTSLEQSRKLAEILPLESADMYYREWKRMTKDIRIAYIGSAGEKDLPCWSLAALLGILPSGYVIVKNYHSLYFVESRDQGKSTNIFNNPIDACVAMIEKLNELNLL